MESDFRFKDLTVAVVGLGLMGGSFCKRLKEIGCRVIGFNRTKEVAKKALSMGIIDSMEEEEIRNAKMIIFCTPEKGTLGFLKEKVHLLGEDTVLTDIAGVKNGFRNRLQEVLPKGLDFISAHPMCGREGEGLDQADGAIFDGANYIIIREEGNLSRNVDLVSSLAKALGCAHVPVVSEEEHDKAVAFTSDLTHVIATSLMNSASFTEETKNFVGGSFKDETRVADINEMLWTSLFLENQENLLSEIESFKSSLNRIEEAIRSGKEEDIKEFLSEARKKRRDLVHGRSEG